MRINLTWKLWILVIILFLSLVSIFGLPPSYFQKGVLITSVEPSSHAFEQGIREGQILIAIDGVEVRNTFDYSEIIQTQFLSNESVRIDLTFSDSEVILFTNKTPEITIEDLSKTNIKLGLDLIGGSRALVRAEGKELSSSEARDLVDMTQNRLNEFGLTDIKVKQVSDLEGNNFMLVEVAGANPKDLQDLISQQGKFEAKVGNETVFIGGERDISSVCRDSRCAFVERCSQSENEWICGFRFEIFLTEPAATRHADATRNLETQTTPSGRYLELPLDLYLDDVLVDSLLIGEGLKGRVVTQISISGSAVGQTRDEAIISAEEEMHHLQTILITGSLPFKLEIIKLDTISPLLGNEFSRVILLAGVVSLALVALVIFARYRNIKSSLALILTSISEIIIILGIASLIEWNLDLPSIAGILIVVGTGIDQQIIILDESKQGENLSLKQKMKRAFTIIMGSYFTAVVAMFPLLWAGAGLLKGFAFTTIIGITAGILITRPAFTDIVKIIEKED